MTFDEAIEELRLAIPEKFYSPTMHDIAVMLEAQTKVINLLRQEYAPTVEMTKNDRDILLHNLQNYPFDVFAESIALSDKEKFGLPANKEFKGLSIKDLMQAWLHPETIKVVDE